MHLKMKLFNQRQHNVRNAQSHMYMRVMPQPTGHSFTCQCSLPSGSNDSTIKGDGNNDDGGNKWNSGNRPHDEPSFPSRRYPLWLHIWIWLTVFVYICVRVRWRQDLKEKEHLLKIQEEAQLRDEQAWEDFLNKNRLALKGESLSKKN